MSIGNSTRFASFPRFLLQPDKRNAILVCFLQKGLAELRDTTVEMFDDLIPLSVGLAIANKWVLTIDLDMPANLSMGMGLDIKEQRVKGPELFC